MSASPASKSAPARPSTGYYSNGQRLESPPLAVRVRSLLSDAYCFAGLYITTLFSLDSTAAAASSAFSTQNRRAGPSATGFPVPRFSVPGFLGAAAGSGGGRSAGPGPSASGGGRRLGTVDQVRGPECRSCQ